MREKTMTQEKIVKPRNGMFPLLVCIGLVLGAVPLFILAVTVIQTPFAPLGVLVLILAVLSLLVGITAMCGFIAVAPNQARVLLLFGQYRGSVVESGFYWVNPFYSKKAISLRVRNMETGSSRTPETKDATGRVLQESSRSLGRPSKVNDRDGNPIEISSVVVWRVVNTAEAMFEVDDYEDYMAIQCEAALRSLASRHPYDSEDHEVSLRRNPIEICDELKHEIQLRLGKAGLEVMEARICHLAYAPEIAAAMLQRQQASAIVAARSKIVEGAVGMVQMALDHLAKDNVVVLDDERRAAMVSNLLVVLCSDRHAQPVVNAGSIYH